MAQLKLLLLPALIFTLWLPSWWGWCQLCCWINLVLTSSYFFRPVLCGNFNELGAKGSSSKVMVMELVDAVGLLMPK